MTVGKEFLMASVFGKVDLKKEFIREVKLGLGLEGLGIPNEEDDTVTIVNGKGEVIVTPLLGTVTLPAMFTNWTKIQPGDFVTISENLVVVTEVDKDNKKIVAIEKDGAKKEIVVSRRLAGEGVFRVAKFSDSGTMNPLMMAMLFKNDGFSDFGGEIDEKLFFLMAMENNNIENLLPFLFLMKR